MKQKILLLSTRLAKNQKKYQAQIINQEDGEEATYPFEKIFKDSISLVKEEILERKQVSETRNLSHIAKNSSNLQILDS